MDNDAARLEPFRKYPMVLAELHLDRRLRGKLDPSDVVQQTLLRACSALGGLRQDQPEVLAAWLRRILARRLPGHRPCPSSPRPDARGTHSLRTARAVIAGSSGDEGLASTA